MIDEIRAIMEERGVTQKQLAKMTGITQPDLSRMLTSQVAPNMKRLMKVCKALGLVLTVTAKSKGK